MKKAVVFTIFLGLLVFIMSCGSTDPISYVIVPKKGFSGENILYKDVQILDSNLSYGMTVTLDQGMVYKVILRNSSTELPRFANDSLGNYWTTKEELNTGWFSEGYDFESQSQLFYAEGPGTPHIAINFVGCGKMEVDIY